MRRRPDQARFEKAKARLRELGPVLRTRDILRAGIHPRTLYEMRDKGILERLGPGTYRWADLPALGNPDLIVVAARVPHGVICLISALAFHRLTTQVPHEVYLALQRGKAAPRLKHPPIRLFRFGGAAFTEGMEEHVLDGMPVRIYSPEKTLADCFKYRNRIGMDAPLEALRLYRQRKRPRMDALLRFARICRVERVMRPYLEGLFG